jgi:hypothetical protein
MAQHTFTRYKNEPSVNRISKKYKNNEIDTIVKHSKPSEVQKKICLCCGQCYKTFYGCNYDTIGVTQSKS